MEILIPLTFFAMIAAIVLGPRYFMHLERVKFQDVIKTAYERGQPIDPVVVHNLLTAPQKVRSPMRDVRGGVIFLAVGIAFALAAWPMSYNDADAFYPMLGFAIIPSMIGLALIAVGIIGLMVERKTADRGSSAASDPEPRS